MSMTVSSRPAFPGIGAMCDVRFIEADGIRIVVAIQNIDGWHLATDTFEEPVRTLSNLVAEVAHALKNVI